MNRNSAKFLTFTGIAFCSSSLLLTIYNIFASADFPNFISLFLFVGGILLIVFSLAFYTEK